MKKIPTAEEFLKDLQHEYEETGEYKMYFAIDIPNKLKEFAKMHVEAAIKACIEDTPSGSSTDTVSYEDVVEALTDSYPLENIK